MSCTCSTTTDFANALPLGPVVLGDGWRGREFTVEVYDYDTSTWVAASAAYPPLVSVVFQIHTDFDTLDTLLELTSAATEITIDDATDWVFTIRPAAIALAAAGDYVYSIRCEDDDGLYATPFKGPFRVTGKGVV